MKSHEIIPQSKPEVPKFLKNLFRSGKKEDSSAAETFFKLGESCLVTGGKFEGQTVIVTMDPGIGHDISVRYSDENGKIIFAQINRTDLQKID